MKTSKAIVLLMAALALSATPALAQRGGGSRSGGGGSSSRSSSSVSSSRSSSSSSSRGSSFSSPSRSSSSSSSSRSSSSVSSSRSSSPSTPSRSTVGSSSRSSLPSSSNRSSSSVGSSRSSSMGTTPSRSSSSTSEARSSRSGVSSSRSSGSHVGVSGREAGRTDGYRSSVGVRSHSSRSDVGMSTPRGGAVKAPAGTVGANGRPSSDPSVRRDYQDGGYARPGHPGGHMPPASRPIHPAPYFHHPWHGGMVHCHLLFWDPIPPRPWYWPGFWVYCNTYWYDYHVTDVAVVRSYVHDTYHVDMITYGISGDIMYAIVRDGGNTYLQVYDKDDHLLAEQKINKKYCNMVIDAENGGCWISKKKNKDPLLFLWADGQLLIYEAD